MLPESCRYRQIEALVVSLQVESQRERGISMLTQSGLLAPAPSLLAPARAATKPGGAAAAEEETSA